MGLFCWQHIMSLWTPSPLLPLRRQSLASLFKHWPPMPDSRAVCLNGDIAISGLFAVLILRNAIQPRGSRFYVTMWVCLEIEHTAAYPSYFFHVCGKCVENGKKWKIMETWSVCQWVELGIPEVNHGDKPWHVFPPTEWRWVLWWTSLKLLLELSCLQSHPLWPSSPSMQLPKVSMRWGKTLVGTPVHSLVCHQLSSSLITFRKKCHSIPIILPWKQPLHVSKNHLLASWPPWHWQNSWPKHRPSSASVQRHQEPAAPIPETEPNLPDEQDDQWLLSLHWCCFSHWSFRGILVVLVVVAVVVVVGFNTWLSWLVLFVVAAAVAVAVALQLES